MRAKGSRLVDLGVWGGDVDARLMAFGASSAPALPCSVALICLNKKTKKVPMQRGAQSARRHFGGRALQYLLSFLKNVFITELGLRYNSVITAYLSYNVVATQL